MRTALYALLLGLVTFSSAQAEPRWWKGNTHAHTNQSDGDSAPAEVVQWYHDNRYNFVVITDHNKHTPIGELSGTFNETGKFLVIAGNEVSAVSDTKPVHLCAINPAREVNTFQEQTITATLQRNVDEINAAGALAQINHPNFGWAFGVDQLMRIKGCPLLEIWNAHPKVNNFGGGGNPSTEEIWDALLTADRRFFGVASDDTHNLKVSSPGLANPGRGWVWVQCESLTPKDIVAALARGDFYSSNGVELEAITSDRKSLEIKVKPDGATQFTVEFIGDGGQVLDRKFSAVSTYYFKGTERYVRARIMDSNGKMAWTQPVFVK